MRTTFVYGKEFWDFYYTQKPEVQDKIEWVIGLVRTLQMVPEKFFKYLAGTNGLYEIRIKLGSEIFRIFCFFDKGKIVVLLNGYQKKTQKTSLKEIEMANKLMKEYFSTTK